MVVNKNEIGQYGFVCYEAKDGKDSGYGPMCASKAMLALQSRDMGNGQKLYIKNFLNKTQRE